MKIKENHTFRKPTGDNVVGCTNLYYNYDDNKIIPCLCFYPAQHKGSNKTKKNVDGNILMNAQNIKTNSYVDAPILEGKHPTLIFNHGYSLFNEANTVQFEELASHGYIILSIGHPKGGSYVYEDGTVRLFDIITLPKNIMEDYAKGAKLFSDYAKWLTSDGMSASLKKHAEYHRQIIEEQQAMVMDSEMWIQENYYVFTKFLMEEKLNLNDHIDIDKIGAFGMSFGGAVALGMSHVINEIKAVANLDGFYYSTKFDVPLKKPTLLIQNDKARLLSYPYLNAQGDTYLVTIKNSNHANYADYNEFMAENFIQEGYIDGKPIKDGLLGEIDPNHMEDILNASLLDFFNKYLLNKDSEYLDKEVNDVEMIVEKK